MTDCGKSKVKLRSYLIDKGVITKDNEIVNYPLFTKEVKKISNHIGAPFNVTENLAYSTEKGKKVEFKEELLKIIDAKNGVFYFGNLYLKDYSPFKNTFLGRTAVGDSLITDIVPKTDLGSYFVYEGEVYIALDYDYKGTELMINAYNPYTKEKFFKIPEEGIEFKNRKAHFIKHNGQYYFFTPSNESINLSTHTVSQDEYLTKTLRENIIKFDNLVLEEDILSMLYDNSTKNLPYEEFKLLAHSHVLKFKDIKSNDDIRNDLNCY